jgi:hypothetical protein
MSFCCFCTASLPALGFGQRHSFLLSLTLPHAHWWRLLESLPAFISGGITQTACNADGDGSIKFSNAGMKTARGY